MHIPKHIGIIPDGNRRWAVNNSLSKEMGYDRGLDPGLELFHLCQRAGIKEITYYGFTVDNTKRPSIQTEAFTNACIRAVELFTREDGELLVVGNTSSPMFPRELEPFTKRRTFGKGGTRVNFLVNYGWDWDLNGIMDNSDKKLNKNNFLTSINTNDISRIDLIIRWGGRRRLSGFLPIQSIYADFYVIDDYWPDFTPKHFYDALAWYDKQDITLGG